MPAITIIIYSSTKLTDMIGLHRHCNNMNTAHKFASSRAFYMYNLELHSCQVHLTYTGLFSISLHDRQSCMRWGDCCDCSCVELLGCAQ